MKNPPVTPRVPLAVGARLPAQANGQTCGIAALAAVVARMGRGTYLSATPEEHRAFQEGLHRAAAMTGVPWPRSLGTSPWALARLASKASGRPYRIHLWSGLGCKVLHSAIANADDAFLYVGDSLVPRHVVAVLGLESAQGDYRIFEPSSGRVVALARPALVNPHSPKRPELGHWRRPILVVAPVPRPGPWATLKENQ